MGLEQILAFAAFAFVAAVTPGPSNVMLTATGAAVGLARGMPALFGVGAGMASMMFLAALGLGTLVLREPALVAVLKGAGAAFLLWLAWKIASAPVGEGAPAARPVGFVGAALFQWLNPKSWLVSVSAAGTYLGADAGGALAQAAALAALFFALALPSGFVWLAFGLAVRRVLRSPRAQRAFNVSMGGLLAASLLLLLR
ncbi:MAG TPA: LysE family translocator [Burkholderiales bacterium]|nr:LysE family translocator [Burkholderiales bacterium]